MTLSLGAEDNELAAHLHSENSQNQLLAKFENSNNGKAVGVEDLTVLLDRDGHGDGTNPSPTPEVTIPKNRSTAHDHFERNHNIFVSFDINTRENFVGSSSSRLSLLGLKRFQQ